MWTRTYFVLLLVRLYFALSPSYIHPDENFQGPEVFAGESVTLFVLPLLDAVGKYLQSLGSNIKLRRKIPRSTVVSYC